MVITLLSVMCSFIKFALEEQNIESENMFLNDIFSLLLKGQSKQIVKIFLLTLYAIGGGRHKLPRSNSFC